MMITKKLVLWFFAGVGVQIVFWFKHMPDSIFWLYNIAILGILKFDKEETKRGRLGFKRFGDDKLSIYEVEEIKFQVYNRSDKKLEIEVRDEEPEFYFKVLDPVIKVTIEPQEIKTISYRVIPTKRGAFTFKYVNIRVKSKLGFFYQMYRPHFEKEYKVYPNIKSLGKYRMMVYNPHLVTDQAKPVKKLGEGLAFESLKEYVYGDEYRKINWKATARENKPIVNLYEVENNQRIYALIDTGRSMSYSIRGYRKLDMALNTALVLSDTVNQNGDLSGMMAFNTKVNHFIMPGKGSLHRTKIMEKLYHIDYTKDSSNYQEAFQYLAQKETHRSLIFLFTDFNLMDEAEVLIEESKFIKRNHMIVVVLIKNEDMHTLANQQEVDEESAYNKAVALQLLEERKKIISLLNRKGLFCIECEIEKLPLRVLQRYLQMKGKVG